MKKQLKAGTHTNRENNSMHTNRTNKLHKIAKTTKSTEHIGITDYSSQRPKQFIKCVDNNETEETAPSSLGTQEYSHTRNMFGSSEAYNTLLQKPFFVHN